MRTCQNDTEANLGDSTGQIWGKWNEIMIVTDYSSGKLHNLLFPKEHLYTKHTHFSGTVNSNICSIVW